MGSLTNWEDSVEEHLSDLVSYKLPKSRAGAIVSRRFVSFFPAGSNIYGPASGTRTLRFVLVGDGLIIPDTLQLKCVAKAASGSKLVSDAGLLAAFSRMRVFVGGQLLEDIQNASRCAQILRMTMPKDYAEDLSIMAGQKNDAFPASGELTLSTPLMCGLRFAEKALPLRAMGSLVLEFEITPTAAEFADAAWTIEQPEIMCDLLHAPEVEEAIMKRVQQGSSIPIVISSLFSTMSSITSASTVNISRSLSKLKRVFVSYLDTSSDKEPDIFRHPTDADYSLQLRIGSRLVPEVPMKDDTTRFYQLFKSIGSFKDSAKHVNITKAQYAGDDTLGHRFLQCLSTEKMEGENWSGLNLKNGDLVVLENKGAAGVNFQHTILEYELVLSIGEINEVLA